MASIVLKRCAVAPRFLTNLRSSITPLSCSARAFNTNSLSDSSSDDEVDRRDVFGARRPILFSGAFDPFSLSPPRRLSEILDVVEGQKNISSRRRGEAVAGLWRSPCFANENAEAVYLRLDMPGVSKEDVKVLVEDDMLTVRGEVEEKTEHEEGVTKYEKSFDLEPEYLKLDEIKAEMKNGVLKILIPKVKQEERKNVVEVKVD